MKNIISLLILGIAIGNLSAHPKKQYSSLNLKLYDQGIFTVMLDNQTSNFPSDNYYISKLKPGLHQLKVIKYYPASFGCQPFSKVIFNGNIRIPQQSKVSALINLFNEFEIYSVDNFYHDSDPVNNYSNCNNDYHDFHGHYANTLNPICMPEPIFIRLKQTIENAGFDNDKLGIAKRALENNSISAQQVLELVELLTFESNKLKLAKFAYQYTFDKQNYFVVNNGFDFNSSINELNKFIDIN